MIGDGRGRLYPQKPIRLSAQSRNREKSPQKRGHRLTELPLSQRYKKAASSAGHPSPRGSAYLSTQLELYADRVRTISLKVGGGERRSRKRGKRSREENLASTEKVL